MIPKAARPKLAQEEFDEAVKANLEDFGMEVTLQLLPCARPSAFALKPMLGPRRRMRR